MAHLLTQQLLPKTGSRRNAPVSLENNEWPPNTPDLNSLNYHDVWGVMLGRYKKCTPKPTNIAEQWFATSSLIRQSCHFRKRLRSYVAAAGGHFEHSVLIMRGQLTCVTETFELLTKKVCKVWFVITEYSRRDYVHLKKWTLKFKLLYRLNHIRYFNKICRICGLNPHLYTM